MKDFKSRQNNILGTFSKVEKDLIDLNKDLDKSIRENKKAIEEHLKRIAETKAANANIQTMLDQNNGVIKRINKLLGK